MCLILNSLSLWAGNENKIDGDNFNSIQIIKDNSEFTFSACKLDDQNMISDCVFLGSSPYNYTDKEVTKLLKTLRVKDATLATTQVISGISVWIFAPMTYGASIPVLGSVWALSKVNGRETFATIDMLEDSISAPSNEFIYDGKDHVKNTMYASIHAVIEKTDMHLKRISAKRK